MKPSAYIPKTLAVLTIGALLGITGCSAPSDQQNVNNASPSAEAVTTPSEVAAPTPTPKPTVNHHPNWVDSVTTTKPLPVKWEGGSGWKLEADASAIYGLQNSMAIVTQRAGVPGVLTTYDNNGVVIDKSPTVTELAVTGMKSANVYTVWSKGKSYLMMLQGGPLVPKEGSTKKAGWGVVFSGFDTTTGKMTSHGVVPVAEGNLEVRMHGGSLHLYEYNGQITRTFIDPGTGKIDLNHDPLWQARVDGVDVKLTAEDATTLTTGSWTVDHVTTGIGAQTIADTTLLALDSIDENNIHSYKTIDAHTGEEPAWVAKIADPESHLVNLDGLHAGVYAFKNGITGAWTFINPTTGKVVKLTKDDTFEPTIIGSDGIVYGKSSAVKGETTPAYLDLNEGEPKTLGNADTFTPLEVTSEGMALFGDATEGYYIVNPAKVK